MTKLKISGGNPLFGGIRVSGAKNAALPIMAAALLTDQDVFLDNVPNLADVISMQVLLEEIGVKVFFHDSKMHLNASNCHNLVAQYELVSKMRASVLVLGPMLARFGKAKVSLPGGCAIGARPVDMHIEALKLMGAHVYLEDGYVIAEAQDGLKGCEIFFDKISVGATENIVMAAVLAKGTTVMHNVAREPEVIDLCNLLNKMGAQISGIGTDVMTIVGRNNLYGANHCVIPDRIEAGTFAVIVAATGGDVEIYDCHPAHLESPLHILKIMGAKIVTGHSSIKITAHKEKIVGANIATSPYPNFPTDLQAQFTALAAMADGVSHITENVFENRFMHVNELMRMGGDIKINDNMLIINGMKELKPAEVKASDLRGSASLIIAGLSASSNGGETTIGGIHHLDRGYEEIDRKLSACGASIRRVD